ncbi:MAG: adenylate/guanylate cyclase domain-containing protein [Pseudomonadota bacterium]
MTTADMVISEVDALLRSSEFLKAYDSARRALEQFPGFRRLQHRAVLSLARAGALERAQAAFKGFGLDTVDDDEDILGLWARLLKDAAFALPHEKRGDALREASGAYERAHAAGDGGYYSAINVASLLLLAGEHERAADWARSSETLAADDQSYYGLATRAEAALVLQDPARAKTLIGEAVELGRGDFAALRSTRRQLQRLCRYLEIDEALLGPFAPPRVIHFCGHMPATEDEDGRFPKSEIPRVRSEISETLRREDIRFGVGSLAAGSDILIAEALIASGGSFEAVLPFDRDEFIEVSVAPFGGEWVARFQTCLAAANTVHYVTEDAWLGDDELFNYASHLGLGLARLWSDRLGAELAQLAVWDGAPPRTDAGAGTVFDLARGRGMGVRQFVIPSRSATPVSLDALPEFEPHETGSRRRRTMVFGDFKGFSRLSDALLPIYVENVLGTAAEVLSRYRANLAFRNTWGDGLFLVFDDVTVAASAALDLCRSLRELDLEALGLPDTLGLRLGMHYGPVYERRDPVLEQSNFFGFHVSRAARIEPITPEGEIYVTDAAAAALAVEASDRFRCDYVGQVPLAKGYGAFPMYALTQLDSA